jgi:hypothetical protein
MLNQLLPRKSGRLTMMPQDEGPQFSRVLEKLMPRNNGTKKGIGALKKALEMSGVLINTKKNQ